MINKKVAVIVFVLLFLASAYTSYSVFSSMPATPKKTASSVAPTGIVDQSEVPGTEECPINGKMLSKEQRAKWEKRRPLGVAIENSEAARPQSGLSSADVVYEAVAEGGITRFLAIFYCQDAPFIGPVRSARVHFLNLLRGYGEYPLYGHVGGANCDPETGSGCANGARADALGQIRKLGWEGYNDLNQFGVPFPYYWRDYERLPGVVTEHTVYSSTAKLWDYAKTKRELTNVDSDNVSWDKTFTPWKFQDDATASDRGTVSKVSFGFWTSFASSMSVTWNYDKTTNTYKRVNGGKPHIDKNNGKQLSAKNVAIMFADESPANDGYDGGHILYDLIGSGDALVFQNGQAIKGAWSKETADSQVVFSDAKGKEIKMVRGQTFVELLPSENEGKVTY